MKKLVFLLSISWNFVNAQQPSSVPMDLLYSKLYHPVATTEMEYNYITKGISNSIANGLDIKKGYLIDGNDNFSSFDNPDYNVGYYQFTYSNLTRTNDTTLAGIIIKAHSGVSGKNYWLCIPIDNEELSVQFQNEMALWDEPMTTAFAQTLSLELIKGKLLRTNVLRKSKDQKTQKTILKCFDFSDGEINSVISTFK